MSSITTILIAKALDGLDARAAATAQNIANSNTDNYRPVRVTFEDSLRAAATRGPEAIAAVQPRVEFAPTPGVATEMRGDLELLTLSQTALRYGALISVLEGQGAMMRAVVEGSR